MQKTVLLADNKTIKVRVLGLFELDAISPPLGPYCYSMLTATGDIIEDVYVFPPEPPKEPSKPLEECRDDDYEYFQWREYNTYQAAIAHEHKRTADYERYLREINQYILVNCLSDDDRNHIVEPVDWQRIQAGAIVPPLTEEVIAQTLRDTFQGFI